MDAKNLKIVFFDGDCGICHRAVRVLSRMDKKGTLYFAPLNGETYFLIYGHKQDSLESVVFYDRGLTYIKARAVLQMASCCGGVYKVITQICSLMPLKVLDAIYVRVAKKRQEMQCRLPTGSIQLLP